MFSNELIRGTLRTIVLKLLAEEEKLYGYQITQKVEEVSKGNIKLTYGALYPTLHKLEDEGLVKTTSVEVDNRLRKYYSLTVSGRKVAEEKIAEYKSFTETMKRLILSKS